MVGIGGGAMNVPLMSMMGIKMHQAVGTSASLGFVIALQEPLDLLSQVGRTQTFLNSLRLYSLARGLCICLMTVILAPLGAQFPTIRYQKIETSFWDISVDCRDANSLETLVLMPLMIHVIQSNERKFFSK